MTLEVLWPAHPISQPVGLGSQAPLLGWAPRSMHTLCGAPTSLDRVLDGALSLKAQKPWEVGEVLLSLLPERNTERHFTDLLKAERLERTGDPSEGSLTPEGLAWHPCSRLAQPGPPPASSSEPDAEKMLQQWQQSAVRNRRARMCARPSREARSPVTEVG